MAVFLVFSAIPDAWASVNVTGRIVYGDVDETLENATSTEAATIFGRGLKKGAPVPHVRVELWSSSGVRVDKGETDENESFTLKTDFVNPSPNVLRVQALNDYVNVKESKLVPLATDNAIGVDFPILSSAYDGSDVTLDDMEIDDGAHSFSAADGTFPASRAFFVASSVYRASRHIEVLTGTTLPIVWVRLGYYLPGAWYDTLTFSQNTIHLQGEQAASIDHEYGHHIENTIGAFGIIPSYIPIPWKHEQCTEMTTRCWPFLEGLASWYGAVNSRGFTSVPGVDFFGDPEASSYLSALGDNWWVESGTCSGSWSNPDAVESVVAQVLWDLVDDHVDDPSAVVPEVAEIPIANVLEVVMYTTGITLPCWPTQPYSHPVTLEQFAETYLDLHSAESVHPDLYSAFAVNGVTGVGGVTDTAAPDAATIASSSHAIGEWYNEPNVTLIITDGHDDFSGSFFYWITADTVATSAIDAATAVIGTEDRQSKETVNEESLTIKEGDGQYLHVQTRDLAGHLGTTAHYGPVRIDLTDPYWISYELPKAKEANLIGTYLHFEWEAGDALSGVDYVSITYSDTANGIEGVLPVMIHAASGSHEFYLDPDYVIPTTAGYFTVTVWDRAGNTVFVKTPDITIVSPFSGPTDLGLALDHGRVVCGDLNGDGTDEIVASGKIGLSRTLQILQISPAAPVQNLAPALDGGDLFLADIDRDGDLDIVAAGDYGGAAPEIHRFQNDGKGTFTHLGALMTAPTMQDMVIRVVDLYGTGEPILVYGGRVGAGAASKELYAYNLVWDTYTSLKGTFFRGGDFEVGDINADGIFEFVTLSYDAAGNGTLDWYLGTAQENQLQWSYGGGTSALYPEIGDVDLGNWDLDNDLELFVMYYVTIPGASAAYSELWEWTGSKFELAVQAEPRNQIAEGDGHIVDIYNDGMSDVFALGRQVGGGLSSWYVTNEKLGRKGTGVPYPVKANQLYNTDSAWGDFDNDGDLDVVVTGTGPVGSFSTVWYESQINIYAEPNDDPPAPQNLQSVYDPLRGGYVFSWDAPGVNSDETAEPAFEYEIRVGNAPGLSDVVSWAHIAGHGQQVAPQVVGARFERFVPMPFGPVDWCVRTVDSGWRRSGCEVVVPVASDLSIACGGGNVTVSWDENEALVLEQASDLSGPWGAGDLTNGIPHGIVDPLKFFRLRNHLTGAVLDVVGYIRKQVPSGFLLIANPFNSAVNTLEALIPAAPFGTQFYKYGENGFTTYTFDDLDMAWLPSGTNVTLNPGEGGFIRTDAGGFEVCFSGKVLQGSLQNPLPIGFSIRSPLVPRRGTLDALGIPGEPGDQIFRFSLGNYTTYSFDDLAGDWLPALPVFEVGEAFFYNSVREKVWSQEYSSQ